MKNKIVTVLIIFATVILAGVAIFTAVRLYQLRQEPVAPTAPESKPKADTAAQPQACKELAFVIETPNITPSPGPSKTPTPTASKTPTPTKTPSPTVTTTGVPTTSPSTTTNPTATAMQTPGSTNTQAPNTPTPTKVAAQAPTSAELPPAGISFPTIAIGALGMVLVIFAFALAL